MNHQSTENMLGKYSSDDEDNDLSITIGSNSIKECSKMDLSSLINGLKCKWPNCEQEFNTQQLLTDHVNIEHLGNFKCCLINSFF